MSNRESKLRAARARSFQPGRHGEPSGARREGRQGIKIAPSSGTKLSRPSGRTKGQKPYPARANRSSRRSIQANKASSLELSVVRGLQTPPGKDLSMSKSKSTAAAVDTRFEP